jgi:prepilin-type N-terminal cleavage/methylation domain-containing protein
MTIASPVDRRTDRDGGFSLTEVLVSMAILSVVVSISGTAIIQTYSTLNKVDNYSVAREQLANSFRRLDKEIRYAQWVGDPATVNITTAGQSKPTYFLEWEVPPDPTLPASPAPPVRCRQLAFRPPDNTHKSWWLTLAAWNLPATTPGPKNILAAELGLSGTTAPFTVYPVGATPYASATPGTAGMGKDFKLVHELVRLRFTATWNRTTLSQDVTFSAQNTFDEPADADPSDCSKGTRS